MEFNTLEKNGIVIMEVCGSILGGPDATQLNDEVHRWIKEGKKNFIVNLQAVDLINSSGLGILISNLTNVKNNGGDLRLSNLSQKIRQIFQITKLASVFKQFETVDDAVKSFS
ncbi:STAS domain-containing protein [bacterium]|nr:MAG: STAS domain-containing protein [bacterium]